MPQDGGFQEGDVIPDHQKRPQLTVAICTFFSMVKIFSMMFSWP